MSKAIQPYNEAQVEEFFNETGFGGQLSIGGPVVRLNYKKTDAHLPNEFLTTNEDGEVISLGRTFKAQILFRTNQIKHFDADGLVWWSNEFIDLSKPVTVYERNNGGEPKETLFNNYYDAKASYNAKGSYVVHYYVKVLDPELTGDQAWIRQLTLKGTSQDAFFKYKNQFSKSKGEHPIMFATEFTSITEQGPNGEYYPIKAQKLEQLIERETPQFAEAAAAAKEIIGVVMNKEFFPKREEIEAPKTVGDASADDLEAILNS